MDFHTLYNTPSTNSVDVDTPALAKAVEYSILIIDAENKRSEAKRVVGRSAYYDDGVLGDV
jgi:hypothetical protein